MHKVAVDAVQKEALQAQITADAVVDVDDEVAVAQALERAQTLRLRAAAGEALRRGVAEDVGVGDEGDALFGVDQAVRQGRHRHGALGGALGAGCVEAKVFGQALAERQIDLTTAQQVAQPLGVAAGAGGEGHVVAALKQAAELHHQRVEDFAARLVLAAQLHLAPERRQVAEAQAQRGLGAIVGEAHNADHRPGADAP